MKMYSGKTKKKSEKFTLEKKRKKSKRLINFVFGLWVV